MMMRALRENTKWIMVVASVFFVGWLVLNWVQTRQSSASTGTNPVVGIVNGREIRYAEWNRALDAQLTQARSFSTSTLSDEQVRQVRQTAWGQLITDILIEQELKRLGIGVTNAEVRQAFHLSPPPDLMSHPAFQTNGAFDYAKYQQYFASPGVDESLLLRIESYYRQMLPRTKLARQLSSGVYVSDEALWRDYRDRNERATLRYVRLDPATIPDSLATPTEDAVRDYYRTHQDEFERPATATVHVVSLDVAPSAADTAEARARADSLRSRIEAGEATFEEVAQEESADSISAADGGNLGRFGKGDLAVELEQSAFSLTPGAISEPVASRSGFHLLRVSGVTADSVTVEHILVPIEMSPDSEDGLFQTLDDLEGIALARGLAEAADSLDLPIDRDVALTEGFDFVPGAGALGVGVDWALDPQNLPGEISDFFENATGYHMLELVDRSEAGTFTLDEVRPRIVQTLLGEKKKEIALARLAEASAGIGESGSLEDVAGKLGLTAEAADPFTRRDFVQGLGRSTEAVGAAFGLALGTISGALDAGEAAVVIQVIGRTEADREDFETIREQLRARATLQEGQVRQSAWLAALRDAADIVDLRDRLNQTQDQASGFRHRTG